MLRTIKTVSHVGEACSVHVRSQYRFASSRDLRAQQIRRRETTMRWLRRLVVPGFTLYGLFLLRPTEGHFIRYLAERRHIDEQFNKLFPPLLNGLNTTQNWHTSTNSSVDQIRSKQHAGKTPAHDSINWPPSNEAMTAQASATDHTNAHTEIPCDKFSDHNATLAPNKTIHIADGARISLDAEAVQLLRSASNSDWYSKHFGAQHNSDDETRIARRRLLFSRNRTYEDNEDEKQETVTALEERIHELHDAARHPPIYRINAQLTTMLHETKTYLRHKQDQTRRSNNLTTHSQPNNDDAAYKQIAQTTDTLTPAVQLFYNSHLFFATAAVVFSRADGEQLMTLKFIGALGMLWKQV